ncbi:hypothetical protein K437DRAFT_256523 [Tilletiaria anomala UBC 951]|uniref:Cytochrome b561 domain-containing protein n=1 Tax=Tilletiaria anomala (strain ATCC 24038 / CBS 436.72 / UBC 951) TaxID=1037660 RepID=A0A066VVS5_TILAU|nr:uncharacterized protein K437DRAFT_256523 [Tilletiaria anomala UBC 951]KDN45601.1 hypothetical protein K437DRAFT_256523 [Tilletiaria anomala UBC 951]
MQSHDRITAVHAVFACIVVLFLLPSTIIMTRVQRSSPGWLRLHRLLNGITVALIILIFGLGMAAVGTQGDGTQFSGDESDLHHKLGLVIFILVLLQALLGIAAHQTTTSGGELGSLFMGRKQWVRCVHFCVGIIIAGLLYWITWNGLHTEWVAMSTEETSTPEAVQVLFWIIFIPPVAFYLVRLGSSTLRSMEGEQQPIMLGGKEGFSEACDC